LYLKVSNGVILYTTASEILNMPEDSAIFTVKVMQLGRVTIPESVRDLLGIKPGDIVEIKIQKRTPSKD